ncbi:MAG: hypothetical protein JWO36_4874 [Myxococcales bacterium]|nr:hypothetical protein [Myxococcales bacterium]
MKRNISSLDSSRSSIVVAALVLGLTGCRANTETPTPHGATLPVSRIAIVGASVSAGMGGTPFNDAFTAAAKSSAVESEADLMMFRDPVAETTQQIDRALAFHPTVIVALDFLFWDIYGSTDPRWRVRALDHGLAELDRARAAGAWIIVGDVPLITTAADWMLPRQQVPAAADLAALDQRIHAWASSRDHVLEVPLAAWTEPLRAAGNIEISPGEVVPAQSLMAVDGLHANALGTWYLLDRLDKLIEQQLPGTPKSALVFVRPKSVVQDP